MVAQIHGEFLSRRTGKKKDGTEYDFVTILSGDETVMISGYDPGAAVKRMDPVKVMCDIRRGGDGRQYITAIR